jgi:phosphomevalonate kinase
VAVNEPQRAISAGGKLFVAGEYAVLWGGEARLCCVGPRVSAVVRRAVSRDVHLVQADGRLSGQMTPLGVHWNEPVPAAFRFVAHAVDLAARAAGREGPGFSIAFEPSTLIDGHKLGIGSSARAAVLAAECARWALQASFDALKLALVAHFEAQGERGSGGDVACCFAGELVRYRRYPVEPLLAASRKPGFGGAVASASPVEVTRSAASRLPMLYAFSGHSASTPVLVREVEARFNAQARAAFVVESDAAGLMLEQALAQGDFQAAKEACVSLQALLDGLGIASDAVSRIVKLAHSSGCTGKQSGAGGGDGVLLIAPDTPTAVEMSASLASRGVWCYPLAVEEGLRGEGVVSPRLSAWLDV